MKKSKKQERIATLCDQALALLRDGKHEAALASFATLEELDPEQPDWPRRAADCHRALGSRAEQMEALGRAAERYMGGGALAKAIAMSRMILNLDPTHARTQQRLLELQGVSARPHLPQPPEPARPAFPQRKLVAAAPAPEKPEAPPAQPAPPPAPKVDATPRPRLEQILRQRRAQSRERRPAAPDALEVQVAEREPIALGPDPSVTAPEPSVVPAPEPVVASEREPVVVPAPEPVAAAPAPELLDPEPEIVPDELVIQSLPAPAPSDASVLLGSPGAAIPHTPVPPSDDAVTLRPARFASDQEGAELGELPLNAGVENGPHG